MINHIGTIATIAMFGRIVLPMPDLASGVSTVMKSTKADSRHQSGVSRIKSISWCHVQKIFHVFCIYADCVLISLSQTMLTENSQIKN